MSQAHNHIGLITPCSVGGTALALRHVGAWRAGPCAEASSFGLMAQLSHALSVRSDEAIGPLLAAATVIESKTASETRSIWTAEALHRAHATLKLFLMLHRSRRRIDRLTRVLERNLAIDLAQNICALTRSGPARAENCAKPLRETVAGLVALFGPGVGNLIVQTDISEVRLTRHRRRALALLTHELVVNAILHAFTGRHRGHIIVTVRLVSSGVAILSVMDDGVGIGDDAIDGGSMAACLAAELGSELHYRRTICGFTKVEAIFNVAPREMLPRCGLSFVRPENANPFNERSCSTGGL